MVITDEDALICDFAETYGIYDYRRLPLRRAAVFASGLRENSRIKIKMSGLNAAPDTVLNAAIADRVGMLVWMQSTDGIKGRNRPVSILEKLLNPQKEELIAAFESGRAFDEERKRLLGMEE